MNREPRYIVIKISDVERYCSGAELEALQDILQTIYEGRASDGKEPLECVCVENDWPEYETVWRMIEARVKGTALKESLIPREQIYVEPLVFIRTDYNGYPKALVAEASYGRYCIQQHGDGFCIWFNGDFLEGDKAHGTENSAIKRAQEVHRERVLKHLCR